MNRKKQSLLQRPGIQVLLSSLICIFIGLIIGFIVLIIIEPSGAVKAILTIIKNFFRYPKPVIVFKYFGTTLVKTVPLLMCALSVLFGYKVGLFNIGVAGQYTIGMGLGLFFAIYFNIPWYGCCIIAMVSGALVGALSGVLKAFLNVNEVISGIMLNWICLYSVNILLKSVKEVSSPYTMNLENVGKSLMMPALGLDSFFGCDYASIAIPLSFVIAILVYFIIEKTKFGYELKATGFNKNAAKYAGMAEKRNTIITLAIGGGLAGLGAAMYYLTGYEQWSVYTTSVPAMGFNGIAAAFLGGLNPVGTIFSSFFIQHITDGGAYVDKRIYSSQISDLISSIIIYLCGFAGFIRLIIVKRLSKKENEKGGIKEK